jgi:arginase
MPVAMLVGRGDQSLVRRLGIRPLSERAVTIAGARDLDPGEVEALAASEVRCLSLEQLCAEPPTDRPLHIHLDVDVVDPGDLPGLLYPAPGGPSLAEVAAALRHLAADARIAAVSVAHTYDQGAPTAVASRRLAAELLAALTTPG